MTNNTNLNLDLKGISRPLTKLIEVVGQGIGKVYEPVGTIIQAKADASARLTTAKAEIAETELWHRANARLMHIELERQKNLEAIIDTARLALPEQVSSEPVDKDWTTHFFEAAKDVSDTDMQTLWARILAGEITEPGTTSRRTLEFLKTLSKAEAEMFVVLLSVSFAIHPGGWRFIILGKGTSEKIKEATGGGDVVRHMADIGILGSESTMVDVNKIKEWRLKYGNEIYRFDSPLTVRISDIDLRFPGKLITIHYFSAIGQEVSNVATQKSYVGFVEDVSRYLNEDVDVSIEKTAAEETSPPVA